MTDAQSGMLGVPARTTNMTKEQLEARAREVSLHLRSAGVQAFAQRVEAIDRHPQHVDKLMEAGGSWLKLLTDAADLIETLAADQSRAEPVGEYARGIEAAAKVVDEFAGRPNDWGEAYYKPAFIAMAREIATAIRALQPDAGEGA